VAAGPFCSDAYWGTPNHGEGRVCKAVKRRTLPVLVAADELDETAVFLVLIEKCKLLIVEGFEEVVP
jgi:hypothetical protein